MQAESTGRRAELMGVRGADRGREVAERQSPLQQVHLTVAFEVSLIEQPIRQSELGENVARVASLKGCVVHRQHGGHVVVRRLHAVDRTE